MPSRYLTAEQIQRLLSDLEARPGGMSRAELQERVHFNHWSPQVFRRELALLAAEGWISISGQTKATHEWP